MPALITPRSPLSAPPLLLFVGRLRYYKGLTGSSAPCRRSTPGWRWWASGRWPRNGNLAAQEGVAGRIAWLGETPDADLPALYHLADLFVLPASHASEAFGLVQVEAMATGVPCVCTELGTGTSYVNQDSITPAT